MRKPYVISIAAISGGGKTTIVRALKEKLSNGTVISFDDYGEKVYLTCDINEWSEKGADCDEWYVDPIVDDIEALIKKSFDFIILDYPFGNLNTKVGKYIDLSVFIDTPLDVALARRIIRDYTRRSTQSEVGLAEVREVSLSAIDEELHFYLERSRGTYARMNLEHKPVSDLVVDGLKSPDDIVEMIIQYIHTDEFSEDEIKKGE